MEHTFEVIFEKGLFRVPPPYDEMFVDGQHIRIKVERLPSPMNVLDAASRVYKGFSAQDIKEMENIILDRSSFFADRITGHPFLRR